MLFYRKYRLVAQGKKNCSRHPTFGQIALKLNQATHNQRHREKPALSSLLQAYYYSAAAMMQLQDLRGVGCGKWNWTRGQYSPELVCLHALLTKSWGTNGSLNISPRPGQTPNRGDLAFWLSTCNYSPFWLTPVI